MERRARGERREHLDSGMSGHLHSGKSLTTRRTPSRTSHCTLKLMSRPTLRFNIRSVVRACKSVDASAGAAGSCPETGQKAPRVNIVAPRGLHRSHSANSAASAFLARPLHRGPKRAAVRSRKAFQFLTSSSRAGARSASARPRDSLEGEPPNTINAEPAEPAEHETQSRPRRRQLERRLGLECLLCAFCDLCVDRRDR